MVLEKLPVPWKVLVKLGFLLEKSWNLHQYVVFKWKKLQHLKTTATKEWQRQQWTCVFKFRKAFHVSIEK